MVLYICLTDEESNTYKVRFIQGQAAVSDRVDPMQCLIVIPFYNIF